MPGNYISILTNLEPEPLEGHRARSSVEKLLRSSVARVIDDEVEALTAEIQKQLSDIASILSSVVLSSSNYEVDSVSMTLSISASGKVELVSLAGASTSSVAALQFTLKKRSPGKES